MITDKKRKYERSIWKLHGDFINQFQLVLKQQTWKTVFLEMSQNLATNLCEGGSEATPRYPFTLNLSIKEEMKLTWDVQ